MPLPPLPSLYLHKPGAAPLVPPLQRADAPPPDDKNRKRPRAEPDAAKTRKPTYLLQKEEKDVLVDEVRTLEEQLETLRLRIGLPTKDDRDAVEAVRASNFDLEEQIHSSRLYLAKLQSLVMRELHEPPVNPLSTYIHLPSDMEERRAILRGMRDHKLRRAEDVAVSRLHHLDHTQPFLSEERFTTPDGVYHCHRLEINPFPNFKSARLLYDAVVIFLYNWEISVTELLNQLAIREDSPDDIDPTIWNQRIVTVADDVGCPEELNTVVFARFRDTESSSSTPIGVIAYDTVDEDDLHPYHPSERTCKFFQCVHLIYEIPRPNEPTPLVVLKSCSFTRQLPPQFELEPGVEDKLRENISRWPVTMLKFLRSFTAATAAAAPSTHP